MCDGSAATLSGGKHLRRWLEGDWESSEAALVLPLPQQRSYILSAYTSTASIPTPPWLRHATRCRLARGKRQRRAGGVAADGYRATDFSTVADRVWDSRDLHILSIPAKSEPKKLNKVQPRSPVAHPKAHAKSDVASSLLFPSPPHSFALRTHFFRHVFRRSRPQDFHPWFSDLCPLPVLLLLRSLSLPLADLVRGEPRRRLVITYAQPADSICPPARRHPHL